MIAIREATKLDLGFILNIQNLQIQNNDNIYEEESRKMESIQSWFKSQKEKQHPVLIAHEENEILGYASYVSYRQRVGYRFTKEHSVYVTDSSIGKGVGSLLMKELERIAKQQSVHSLIGAIDSQNESSVMFHLKMGFTKVGEFKEVGFRKDCWLTVIFVQKILSK